MKKSILLALLPLLLAACTSVTPQDSNNPSYTETPQQSETGGEQQTGGQTETGGNTETGGEENTNPEQVTTNLSIAEWQNWYFNDGTDPCYNDDWDFYYGDSHKPYGRLWPNSAYKNLSGVEFVKNCYMISPKFNTYNKVEMRFYFWFSHHTSSQYSGTAGQPQFIIEEYDNSNKLIGTTKIEIERKDVPKDGKAKECRVYVENYTMTWFKLKWNNYIPNGVDGYSAILTQVGLKGHTY